MKNKIDKPKSIFQYIVFQSKYDSMISPIMEASPLTNLHLHNEAEVYTAKDLIFNILFLVSMWVVIIN